MLAVIALTLLVLPAFDRDRTATLELGSEWMAIRLGLVEPPTEPVTIAREHRHQFAARRVPTTDDRVVLYLVGSTHPESRN